MADVLWRWRLKVGWRRWDEVGVDRKGGERRGKRISDDGGYRAILLSSRVCRDQRKVGVEN
jgi:hypothetical protein